MEETKSLNRTQLCKVTKAPVWLIVYLKGCDRLPIIQESQGRGYPTLYHPDSIQIVKDHLKKQRFND
jgi:hypothetical protein